MTAWRKSSYSGGGGGTTECVEVSRSDITDAGSEQGRLQLPM